MNFLEILRYGFAFGLGFYLASSTINYVNGLISNWIYIRFVIPRMSREEFENMSTYNNTVDMPPTTTDDEDDDDDDLMQDLL